MNLVKRLSGTGCATALRMLLLGLLTLGIPLDAAGQYSPPASNRSSIPLSGSWRFLRADGIGSEMPGFDDSRWATVTVPHTWNSIDGQDGPDVGGDHNGRSYYRGVGSYRRHFSVPVSYAGRRLYLQFDGANLVTDVWVNGIHAGRHEGGFTIFRFDVTAFLNTAVGNDNVITVKVDNANSGGIAPIEGDFTFFGGLYRDVSLVVTDRLSAEMMDYGSPGVYLSQTNVTQASANLTIKTLVRNGNPTTTAVAIKSVIVDAAANIVQTLITRTTVAAGRVGSVVQHTTIANPHLWDGRSDPYLYSVYVEIREGTETGPVRDVVPAQPLGFRSYSVDPNQGFRLNGRYLDLHGVNRHQDRLNKGWAISQTDQDQDMRLIEEIGATAVRLAHYPHAQYFYSLADKKGLIVWAELPIVNAVGGQAFSINAKQQLTELIRQSYNHPAIVFWGMANEVLINPWLGDAYSLLVELQALAKQEDPYRITTLAHCCGSDTHPTTNVTDTVGYNKYYGWYEDSYQDFGNWADNAHATMPASTFSVSEYGAGASIFLHAQNPQLSMTNHTEEYQALFHEAHWLAMKTRPYLWGKFVWNMFDFASDSRTEGDTNGRNDKGLVTYDRETKKDAFYWYKANWTTAPMVYITSRRWTQRTVSTTDVKIYSNADVVELIVNGVSLGTLPATNQDRIFNWTNVVLTSGANWVQAIGRVGAATVTDIVDWNLGTPKVTISSPLNGDTFVAPGDMTITATSQSSLTKVEFFAGASKLGEDTNGSDGWTLPWTSVPAGRYVLTARSTDPLGSTISPDVRVTVDDSTNIRPAVSVTSPANDTTVTAGSNLAIVATASDSDGTVDRVSFFQGTTKLADDGNWRDGWSIVLVNVLPGHYSIVAKATDNLGSTTTSLPVNVTVTGSGSLPPTIAVPARATPATAAGATTVLSVLGADDGGEANLTYTWTTTGTPPAVVSFSVNGVNVAKNAVASFVRAGIYNFRVTVRDREGGSATSSVAVTVTQTLTAILVSPATATVPVAGTQQFTASATDQFAIAMSLQPAFTWAVSGGGSMSTTGLFTAGSIPGTGFGVTAGAAGRSGAALVSVTAGGGFSANINFQPASAPTFPGYLVDAGAVFGDRGNGLSYGWSQDVAVMARDRNHALSPDQRHDTLIHMGTLSWDIAVPNGTYNVHAAVGDPSNADVNSKLTVEGVLAVNGLTSAASPWLQGTVTVTVNDGRLTIGNQAGSYNKICFIEIVSTAVVTNQPPAVSLGAPANGATFTTPVSIAITANATDMDGTVAKVEFFAGATKLGEDTNGSDGWSLIWSSVPAGTHTLTARATDNGAAMTTSSGVVITVSTPAPTIIRLDVGSSAAFTDSAGNAWQPDQFGSGGTVSYKSDPIANTVDDDLFRTYRFGTFTYAVPVANGTYDVYLQHIETWWSAPGQRVFSVTAEGTTTLPNIDLYAIAGAFTPVEQTFRVTVTDGVLNLSFISLVDNAIVSAIAIVRGRD